MPQPLPVRITVTTPSGTVWEVPQFVDLSLQLSMKEFADSFELTLGDPEGSLASKVYNDCTVDVYFGTTSVLTGKINRLTGGEKEWATNIHLSGRSKGSEWAESDAIPRKYKKTTDNEVIKDLFAGSGFTFDLGDPKTYADWDVGLGVTKAEAATKIAQEGGFYLWHSGSTISKKKVPSAGTATKTYASPDVEFDAIPVLADETEFSVDTSHVRSQIIFFATDSKHEKVKETRTITPTLKLRSPERTLALTRIQRVAIDAKDKVEAKRVADDNAFRAQPAETLTIAVRGRDDLALNAVAKVILPRHAINTSLVCYEKHITVRQNGNSTTKLSFVPLGRPLP